jgi:hypothetical protein
MVAVLYLVFVPVMLSKWYHGGMTTHLLFLTPLLTSLENSRCRTGCPHPRNPPLQKLVRGKVARPGGEDGIFIPLWWRDSGVASSPENRFRGCGGNLVGTRQCCVREGLPQRDFLRSLTLPYEQEHRSAQISSSLVNVFRETTPPALSHRLRVR